MRYYEIEGNIRKEYELEIDKDRLSAIETLLDRWCSVNRYRISHKYANNKDDAIRSIESSRDKSDNRRNIEYNILSCRAPMTTLDEDRNDYSYEEVYRDSVELSTILAILKYNRNAEDYMDYNTNLYNQLLNYGNSIDFVPFKKRVEMASEKINQAIANNEEILEAVKEYGKAAIEERLNRDFNFEKLDELYQESLKCFKKTLIEETTIYKIGKKL